MSNTRKILSEIDKNEGFYAAVSPYVFICERSAAQDLQNVRSLRLTSKWFLNIFDRQRYNAYLLMDAIEKYDSDKVKKIVRSDPCCMFLDINYKFKDNGALYISPLKNALKQPNTRMLIELEKGIFAANSIKIFRSYLFQREENKDLESIFLVFQLFRNEYFAWYNTAIALCYAYSFSYIRSYFFKTSLSDFIAAADKLESAWQLVQQQQKKLEINFLENKNIYLNNDGWQLKLMNAKKPKKPDIKEIQTMLRRMVESFGEPKTGSSIALGYKESLEFRF